MSKKVEILNHGTPHFYATCQNCEWTYEDFLDRQKGYNEIRKHVSKTGHIIHLEKSVHTDYGYIK